MPAEFGRIRQRARLARHLLAEERSLQWLSTCAKNSGARGSFDCPSQNMACLRASGLRWLRATSIRLGTPSSLGNCLSAKTAFFLTSVSGSFWIASAMAEAAL